MGVNGHACVRNWMRAALVAFGLGLAVPGVAADADSYLRSAEEHMQRNDLRSAVIELKNALQRDPEHADARAMLGQVYLRAGAPMSAEKEFSRAAELGAPRSDWVVPLAKVRIATGRAQAVLDELKPLPDDAADLQRRIRLVRAQAAMVQKKLDVARGEIERAAAEDPEAADLLVARAQLAAVEGDYEQARSHVESSLERDPGNGEAHVLHGRVLQAMGMHREAVAAYDRALSADPTDIGARMAKAATLLGLRDLDAAEEVLDGLSEQARKTGLGRYLQAALLAYRKRYEESQTELRELLRVAPDYAPAELLIGAVSYELDQLETAAAHLSRYAARHPDHVGAGKLLGAVRLKLDDVDGALQALARAERSAPDDAQLLALLGTAHLKQGEHAKGTAYLTRAAELAPDVAALRTQLGIGRLGSGEADRALEDLQAAVALDPDLIQADILLVLIHIRQEQFDDAVQAAQAMAKRHPDSPMPYNLLGAAYLGKGDRDQARHYLEKAVEVEPTFDTARLNLARMHEVDGDQEAAERLYRDVLQRDAGNLQALLGLARIANQRSDSEALRSLLEQARDAQPEAMEPRLLLTRLHLSQGETLKATAEARALMERHPSRAAAVENLAMVQLSANEPGGAVRSLRRLSELQPESARVWQMLATAHLQNGDRDGAFAAVEKALALEPDHVGALVVKAGLLLQRDDIAGAHELAVALQERHPKAAIGYQLTGDIEAAQGRHAEAAKAYEKAQALQPSGPRAMALARVRAQQGDADGALQALAEWVEQAPDDAAVRLALASRLQAAGRGDEAISHYEGVREQQPDNVVALNNLAWLYLERGDRRAAEYAARAHELQPERPEIADTYGWVLVQQGSVTEGLRLIQQAAVLAPHSSEIRYHLAVALSRSGNEREATKELERLVGSRAEFPGAEDAKDLLQQLRAKAESGDRRAN